MKQRVTGEDLQRDPYAVWNAYVKLIGYSGQYEELNDIQLAAHLVFRYESEVQNGGHLQFFENESAELVERILAALNVVGADSYVPILSEAINRWRSREREKLESVEDYVAEALDGEFSDLDHSFYNAQPPLIKVLERYLNQQQDEFVIVEG